MDVQLDIAWRLGCGQYKSATPTLFRLLRAIDEFGSLARAARSINISYRNAWNLVNHWADQLGQPLVVMERGRGTTLSPLGKKLLWAESYTQDKTSVLLSDIANELREALDTVDTKPHVKPLTIFASHCLTHSILKEVFLDRTSAELDIKNAGSAKALTALAEGQCTAAGFHMVDGDIKTDFVRRYRHCINPKQFTFIHAFTRRQGLIVAADNPKEINDIGDLTRTDIHMVNRQLQSGTRLLLDSLLRRNDIQPQQINGYETVEFTHSAVGALVASGSADAGVGTEASAAQFGLGFIPLANENYFYATANTNLHSPEINNFTSALVSEAFRKRVRQLEGYNPKDSGKRIPAETVFF